MIDDVGVWTRRLVALLCVLRVPDWIIVDAYTWDDVTALDTYVQGDDGYFSWEYLATYTNYTGVTIHIVNMTSQKWQDESFASRAIWWHTMGVVIPNDIKYPDAAFLLIAGSDNDDDEDDLIPGPLHPLNLLVAGFANDTQMCGAYILHVPNQPIVFSNDPTQRERSEDRIIAWSWRTYLDDPTPDPTVILRMPMTKAAKRGLDTIHEVAKEQAPSTHIDRFIVSGASKRGWTTWSLACTDQRVVAMFPMVFSLLNFYPTLQNHFMNLDGAWSFAFGPYYDENLTAEFYNPKTDEIFDIEDMYRYKDRLAGMPKLEMVSSGDEFFLLDDSLQWWDNMTEPKWMMMLPNAEHSMAPHYRQIYRTAVSFTLAVFEEITLPDVSWIMQETDLGGLIVVDTIPKPKNITAWSATTLVNDTRRDYRLAAISPDDGEVHFHPVLWHQDITVIDFGNGYQYGVAAEQVEGEWVGFFIEATWGGPPPHYYDMTFTTQVNVVPYTHPRGPCVDNADCYGYLV